MQGGGLMLLDELGNFPVLDMHKLIPMPYLELTQKQDLIWNLNYQQWATLYRRVKGYNASFNIFSLTKYHFFFFLETGELVTELVKYTCHIHPDPAYLCTLLLNN